MKYSSFTLSLTFLFIGNLILAQDPLQSVTDIGSTTDNHIEVTNQKGIGVTNTNITNGYDSWKIGQFGGSTQFMRIVPYSTHSDDYQWANAFYFDFTNMLWGVNGEFLFEGRVDFSNQIQLATGSGNGIDFGSDWKQYVREENDELLLTHDNTGGAELKIINIDGDWRNSHLLVGGKVGIGVGIPTEILEIDGNIGIAGSEGQLYQVGPAKNATSGLSIRATTNPADGDNLFTVESVGSVSRFGVTQANGAWIKNGLHIGAQYDNNMPEMNSGLIVDGKVGIGTTNPTEKLEVYGTIRSKEVKVEANNWPDYVFEEDYNLRTLEETEAYIKANKHLPEIPSAKEMESSGVQLGEMNMLLLKKIEELTLHTIEQQKKLKKQDELEKKIDELLIRIEKLENE